MVSERDLKNLKNKFENKESKASMLATGEEKPEKFGVLSITNDEVDSIMEKPEEPDNHLVNTGIYIFKPEIFDVLENLENDQNLLVDAVSHFAENDQATFELIEDYWIDIGDLRTLKKADRIKREFKITETEISDSAKVHESAEITGNAIIEDEAQIKPNTVIQGDVFIGEGTDIEPNTRIKNSTICRGSIIDAQSIKQSNIFQDNIIDSGVCIEDCILGEDSEIRSGTVIRESFIGARSFIDMNNSIRDMKFVPDARTDLSEISK
ncbi:MAG: nucleoside-diphosphate-sugar pyrophosphorylase [Candidatus Nanosalina sp. J07AB43]|nr:MAG: nucleoside-diphosphate-sugar pyrophosphorylase [Candidatus Nanosalina sp. J07AB43]